ncbi:3'-5' exonuclease [Marinomonas sp. C2222]|uniref:3'-5' exonuclease n=1 Tax=Marinomonas sargassi TaxID=2984494 RepID=A0ABT2YPA4_9GAMM|nr:3'-5' exonuclease [Marinomonas sargassi]MCV2401707.1 3'-5' exonuclease [Marinomonas sargassi]
MPAGLLQHVKNAWENYQANQKNWAEWDYLVLDIETSGLNPKQDSIVSLGWVCIQDGLIELGSARHIVLENAPIDEQVGIHMITEADVQSQGKRQESVLRYLRQLLRNRVLVMHHAPMELGFLKKIWQQESFSNFSLSWLDTLAIERTKANRSQQPIQEGGFRLDNCRERYGLPAYAGHDALTDALATAELLLAQVAYQGPDCRLHDLNQLGGGRTRLSSNQ